MISQVANEVDGIAMSNRAAEHVGNGDEPDLAQQQEHLRRADEIVRWGKGETTSEEASQRATYFSDALPLG